MKKHRFNIGKTLEQLEAKGWELPEFQSGLVLECNRLAKTPLERYTEGDLCLMIGQKFGLPYLMPLALDKLERNPWLEARYYEGDLLENVTRVEADFWTRHPDELHRLNEIISRIESHREMFQKRIRPAWLKIFGGGSSD